MEVEWKLALGNCYKIPPIHPDNLCNPAAAFIALTDSQYMEWWSSTIQVLSGGVVMERDQSLWLLRLFPELRAHSG